jgi:hypothetical protein
MTREKHVYLKSYYMTKLTYRAETQAWTMENSNRDEIFKYIRRNQRKK